MVAEDYRTGDILAYVGSAGYYRKKTPQLHSPAGRPHRRVLATAGLGLEADPLRHGDRYGAVDGGHLLLDQQETFSPGWTPKNADGTYRGLVRVREAIQQSLNIPAIRALQRVGSLTVRKYAVKAGFTFLGGNDKMLDQANLAGALGTVEVRPLDMTTAFGAFGNGGKVTKPRYILKVVAPDGTVIYEAGKPITKQVWKPATAYVMADILAGNTNRAINPAWGAVFEMHNTRDGSRRDGGHQDRHDQRAQGLLDLRHPADAQEQEATRARGRRLVRQQRQLEPQPRSPALLDGQRRPDLGGLRARVHEQQASPRVQATEGCRQRRVRDSTSRARSPAPPTRWTRRAPRVTTTTPNTSGSTNAGTTSTGGGGSGMAPPAGGSSGMGPGGGGSSGMGGGPAPAPTCRPGSTTKPPGCTVLAPG